MIKPINFTDLQRGLDEYFRDVTERRASIHVNFNCRTLGRNISFTISPPDEEGEPAVKMHKDSIRNHSIYFARHLVQNGRVGFKEKEEIIAIASMNQDLA